MRFICMLVFCALLFGWISNVYQYTKLDFKSPYKAEAIRTIGLIPPIGAVIGYIKINDGITEQGE